MPQATAIMKFVPCAAACVLLAAALISQTPGPQSPDEYVSPAFEHRFFFEPDDPGLATLTAAGAVLHVEDYGSFILGIVDERRAGGRSVLLGLGLAIHDEQAVIGLNGSPLDTADEAGLAARLGSIPAFLRANEIDAPPHADSLWLVQFIGPIRDEWLTRLAGTGAVIVSPMASNAYVVVVPAASLATFAGFERDPVVQWVGAYHPFFRLSPELRALDLASTAPIDVTIQLIAGEAASNLQETLQQARVPELRPTERVLGYVNLRVSIPANLVPALAAHPAVFGIEPLFRPRLLDEVQGQIVAGNLNAIHTGPSGTGYLAWLNSKGFFQVGQFAFAVDMTDSGIDRGSLTDVNDEFKVLGPGGASRVVYAFNYSTDPLAECGDGHGNLGASIVGGYNALTGTAYEDAGGYNYGLGICPFVQLGASKVFSNASNPDFLANTVARFGASYGAGARVSNNSWGLNGGNDYNADCQAHDSIVRDASPGGGNQDMTVVFAAGNDGNGANSVHPPATAKNVITVGASESYRPTVTDGCTIPATGADNAMDIINFSSRGPCMDMRKKPDIMAPGTHIQGARSRSLNYNAGGVCDFNWPLGQTLYTWGSGTSEAAPAISGSCALVRQDFINHGLPVPSPAMIKATLMTSTRYMTGLGANDTLWSNNQGMGLVDLGRAFDGVSRARVDQVWAFGATGQTYVVSGTIASGASPFRVGLVWTDPPGPITGNSYVNNLDLQVTVNGTLYRGNVFTGQNSVTGGAADVRNNSEFVFLPAGTTGSFVVTVVATNIAGDGVPGNADMTDQDFALVVYNGTPCQPAISVISPSTIVPPLAAPVPVTVTGSCFVPNSVVYANGVALATTYVSPTSLTCTLTPSVPQSLMPGGICINVQNAVTAVSNPVVLVVGSGNNAGTIRRDPLAPALGTNYAIVIEGGVPFAPFSLFGDIGAGFPYTGFPDAVSNFVLGVGPPTGSGGPLIVVIDGIGVFGPPSGATLDGAGRFVLSGIWLPSPAIGITATLQVAYLDPSSPIGLRLTWARFPEQL